MTAVVTLTLDAADRNLLADILVQEITAAAARWLSTPEDDRVFVEDTLARLADMRERIR